MADITQEQIERAIKTTCATVLKNEHYLSGLDGLGGYGVFGTSLVSCVRFIYKEWYEIPKTDIYLILLKITMLVTNLVGGISVPNWCTGFRKSAWLSKSKS